jgi:thymidylate synthase
MKQKYRRLRNNIYFGQSTFFGQYFKINFYKKVDEVFTTTTPPYDVYDKSTFYEGNYLSPSACGIIWTWNEDRIPDDWISFIERTQPHCAIVSPIRTVLGLKYVFKNLALNPNIRYLIICAPATTPNKNRQPKDIDNGHLVGTAIVDIWSHGVNKEGEIIRPSKMIGQPKVPDVSKDLFDIIRENVEIIDLRGANFETVERVLRHSHDWPKDPYRFSFKDVQHIVYDRGAWGKPVLVSFPEVPAGYVTAIADKFLGGNMSALVFETIDDAWLGTIDYVSKNGISVVDERGTLTLECLFVKIIVQKPWIKPELFDKLLLEKYISEQLSTEKVLGFEYVYGERILNFDNSTNQINEIVERLLKDLNTRRAYGSLWDPRIDFNLNDPPCFTNMHFFVRNNKLILKVEFRSHHLATVDNDLKIESNSGAYIPNLYLAARIQELVYKKLKCRHRNLKRGSLILIAGSEHLYVKPSSAN